MASWSLNWSYVDVAIYVYSYGCCYWGGAGVCCSLPCLIFFRLILDLVSSSHFVVSGIANRIGSEWILKIAVSTARIEDVLLRLL